MHSGRNAVKQEIMPQNYVQPPLKPFLTPGVILNSKKTQSFIGTPLNHSWPTRSSMVHLLALLSNLTMILAMIPLL